MAASVRGPWQLSTACTQASLSRPGTHTTSSSPSPCIQHAMRSIRQYNICWIATLQIMIKTSVIHHKNEWKGGERGRKQLPKLNKTRNNERKREIDGDHMRRKLNRWAAMLISRPRRSPDIHINAHTYIHVWKNNACEMNERWTPAPKGIHSTCGQRWWWRERPLSWASEVESILGHFGRLECKCLLSSLWSHTGILTVLQVRGGETRVMGC